MKIIVNRESLLKRLVTSHSIVSDKPIMPITGSSLIWIEDGSMKIKTTNTQTTVEVFLPIVSVEGEAEPFVCDTKSIQKVIQTLKSEDIYIEVSGSSIEFGVNGGRRKAYVLPLEYSADTFPKMPSMEMSTTFKVKGAMISDIISKIARFVPIRHVTHAEGFLMEQDEKGNVYIMAVKNEVLALAKFNIAERLNGRIIIPLEVSNVIEAFKTSADVEMSISDDNRFTSFFDGATRTTTCNLSNSYVNALQVFNSFNEQSRIVVDRANLYGAITRTSSMIVVQENNGVTLHVKKMDLNVESNDIKYSRKADESVELKENKDCSIRISFSGSFILPVLSCLVSKEIPIMFSTPTGLSVIHDIEQEAYELKFIVMPMQLNNN